jgi:protein-disulfide isomerase
MTTELKTMIGIGIATLGLFVGGIWWASQYQNPALKAADPARLTRADSPRIGSASAKVTLVEFGDYQCPSCATANPTVKAVMAKYPNEVTFVFRHFPLSQHATAPLAAEAAEAAGAQGKYWEMHNMLYEKQTEWASANAPLDIFTKYAEQLGLNVDQFKTAVTSNSAAGKIQQDSADGSSLGVNSTPTFYINGYPLTGSLQELSATIEKAIAVTNN